MTNTERQKIRQAMTHFLADDEFQDGMDILSRLIGVEPRKDPISLAMPVTDMFHCSKCGRRNGAHKNTCPYMIELQQKIDAELGVDKEKK